MPSTSYLTSILFALCALLLFAIPPVLFGYTIVAFFFGPPMIMHPALHVVAFELIGALISFTGIVIGTLVCWMSAFVMSAKARYEWHYCRYVRSGKDPQQWGPSVIQS